MTASSPLPAPNLMPLMRYRNLADAMGWLETAFAFEKQMAVSDGDGGVIYGQMAYRGGLIMMGAVRNTDLDKLMCQPDEVGGVETQSCYVVIDDADAHYARALDAGAEIVLELKSDGLGRRGYSCRDPEGHIWNFGTHNPGRGLHVTTAAATAEPAEALPPRRRARTLMSLAALLALGLGGWWLGTGIKADLTHRLAEGAARKAAEDAERAYAELVRVRSEKRKAEEDNKALASKLAAAEAARTAATSGAPETAEALKQSAEALQQEQAARKTAEAAVAALRTALKREQEAAAAALEAKRVSEEKLEETLAAAESRRKAAEATPPPAGEPAPTAGPRTTAAPEAPAAPQTASTSPASHTASGIETSATGARADAPQVAPPDDPDAEARPRAARKADEKDAPRDARRSVTRGGKGRGAVAKAQPKFPAYVTDVKHVWPYNSWSN